MPKFCANLSMLFTELDFLDRFEAAVDAGFTGVEFLFPYGLDAAELADRLNRHGLVQALHNMPPGDWEAGERGIAILSDRVSEFRDNVGKAIDYAKALGCGRLHCMAGIAPLGADRADLEATFVDNLRFAAAALKAEGIKCLIEPINTRDIPGYFLNHTHEASDIIAKVGSDNLFIQYDIYHMQIMEGDLSATIAAHLGEIAHMQLADTPGRHEPGTGEINYPFLFSEIDRLGYDGWIGCEYRPLTTTEAGLGWFAAHAGRETD